MGVKIGTSSIDDIKLGTTQVDKVMLNGKNLMNIPTGTGSSYGIDWTRSSNSYTVTGASNRSDLTYRFLDSGSTISLGYVIPAGTYTISYDTVTGATTSQNTNFQFRDIDNTVIVANIRLGVNNKSKNLTLDRDAYYIRISVEGLPYNESVNITYGGIQLEAGSTPTTYEPYIGEVTLWQKSS